MRLVVLNFFKNFSSNKIRTHTVFMSMVNSLLVCTYLWLTIRKIWKIIFQPWILTVNRKVPAGVDWWRLGMCRAFKTVLSQRWGLLWLLLLIPADFLHQTDNRWMNELAEVINWEVIFKCCSSANQTANAMSSMNNISEMKTTFERFGSKWVAQLIH